MLVFFKKFDRFSTEHFKLKSPTLAFKFLKVLNYVNVQGMDVIMLGMLIHLSLHTFWNICEFISETEKNLEKHISPHNFLIIV